MFADGMSVDWELATEVTPAYPDETISEAIADRLDGIEDLISTTDVEAADLAARGAAVPPRWTWKFAPFPRGTVLGVEYSPEHLRGLDELLARMRVMAAFWKRLVHGVISGLNRRPALWRAAITAMANTMTVALAARDDDRHEALADPGLERALVLVAAPNAPSHPLVLLEAGTG